MTIAQAAQRVKVFIESLGIVLHPQSRIAQMVTAMEGGGVVPFGDKAFPAALEGLRDIRILDFVITQVSGAIPVDVLRKRLRRVVKDSLRPQDNLTESPGCDIQCELYVAAVASKAGLKPSFDEPDVCCELDGEPLGITVKRVKNHQRFEEHFRKAVRQIEASGVRGVIAMDMSLAFNRTNRPLNTPASVEEMQLAHQRARKLFVDKHHGRMKEWINGREVRGLVIIDSILRLHPQEGWFWEAFDYYVPFDLHNQRRYREFDRFRQAFMGGHPTPAIVRR